MIDESASIVVRPGEDRALTRVAQFAPEVLRHNAILRLMEGRATLSRISKEQIILESLVDSAEELGYKLPATKVLIRSARELSPGLDGLGRGEAVKCLTPTPANVGMFPASAFAQEEKPGLWARFLAFVTGARNKDGGS